MQTSRSVITSTLPSFSSTALLRYVEPALPPHEDAARQRWVTTFAERLATLKAEHDVGESMLTAQLLWEDLAQHDPEIAAEMEYESDLGL